MARPDPAAAVARLIPMLPPGEFIQRPEEATRFAVRLLPDGSLYFRGTREQIAEFTRACAAVGLDMHVRHVALCG